MSGTVLFLLASDIKKQMSLEKVGKVEYSILDDVVLVQPHKDQMYARLFNVDTGKDQLLQSVADSFGCEAHIVHETEAIEAAPKDKLLYSVHCKTFLGLFSIQASDMEIHAVFKTQGATLGSKHHGRVQNVFGSSRGFLVQFADLALMHFSLPTGSQKWVREESLSTVKQVEVLSQDTVKIESSFEYVKSVKQPVPLAEVPARIVNRYKENLNYLVG